MKKLIYLLSLILSLPSLAVVTWQQQAERLQKVSMTLTEAIPVSTPITERKFELFGDISVVPKVNSHLGSKTEDTNTPPVHMIPSIRYNHHFSESFKGRIWIGALPSFVASFLTEHTVNQYLAGFELQQKIPKSFYLNLGYQLSTSSVKGSITEKNSHDEVDAIAGIAYAGLGQNLELGFWNINLGARRNDSEFYIEEDKTTYKFSDQLEDSNLPLFSQVTLGTHYKSFTFAFTQLYVPRRLMMPKISLIYGW